MCNRTVDTTFNKSILVTNLIMKGASTVLYSFVKRAGSSQCMKVVYGETQTKCINLFSEENITNNYLM